METSDFAALADLGIPNHVSSSESVNSKIYPLVAKGTWLAVAFEDSH